MDLRKKKKHLGEVNMSSMTDIIFILLVFFMLTSTLVKFFSFQLPKSEMKKSTPVRTMVSIDTKGEIKVNDKISSFQNLETDLKAVLTQLQGIERPIVTIAADNQLKWQEVTKVQIVINKLKAGALIATEPKK